MIGGNMSHNSCIACTTVVLENILVCSGPCCKVAHYKCVGITKSNFNLITNSKNIHWFCDKCSDVFGVITNQLSLIAENYENIQLRLKNLEGNSQKNAAELLPQNGQNYSKLKDSVVAENPIVPELTDLEVVNEPASTGLPRTMAESVVPAIPHGSLLKSQSSFGASTSFADVVKSPPVMPAETPAAIVKVKHSNHTTSRGICGTKHVPLNFGIKTVAPMAWIHLSRFDPKTSEDDILAMANICLDKNALKIRKLIPKNYSNDNLEYVCFKLGFNEELLAKALDPSTWPIGVFVRKFDISNFRTSLPPHVKFRSPAVIETSA